MINVKLWNPTSGDIEFKYDQRTFIMKPSGSLIVSDKMAKSCMKDFSHLGLVDLHEDTDSEKNLKKVEGLMSLMNFYWQQLQDWNSHVDDKRNAGQSILGEFPRVKQLKRLVAAMEKELGVDRHLNDEWYEQNGYNEVSVNHGKIAIHQPVAKKRGRPARVNTSAATVESQV